MTPPSPAPVPRRWWQRSSASAPDTLAEWSCDSLVLLACAWFVATTNGAFWRGLLAGRTLGEPGTAWLVLASAVALIALHFVFVAPLAHRRSVRPMLVLLVLVAAFASYFIERFGVVLDTGMLRNVLRTDISEARELLSWAMLPHLLWHAGPPLLLLWWVRPARRAGLGAALRRIGLWLGIAALGVGALLSVFQEVAATMRNHKELRFLITPGNVAWSLAVVLDHDARAAAGPREAIGLDAGRGAWAGSAGRRPLRIVLVVGETARAANWGLNGYARQTTPQMAAMADVISFARVTSCGTHTEVSLPCMFSPGGRRHHDEARIRRSESMLHVLQRSGIEVYWRDNQSGCKGVCDGLPNEIIAAGGAPDLCDGERCFDEALLRGLDARLAAVQAGRVGAAANVASAVADAPSGGASQLRSARSGPTAPDQLIVLHQLGNHGPAYDRRYPAKFRRFLPVCATADLQRCSRAEIVNAYDNALLYTDHVLAQVIAWLRSTSATHDSALIYVSDHGESLGENGLYLHGLPYAIAPDVQTQVPMLMWLSDGLAQARGIDLACLHQRAMQAASHDNLFHSLLGLLDVNTALYEPGLDVFGACRR